MNGSRTVKNGYKSSIHKDFRRNNKTKKERKRGGGLGKCKYMNCRWQQDYIYLWRNPYNPCIYKDLTAINEAGMRKW